MSKKMLGDIMKQAQKLQAEMAKVQEEAKTKTVEGYGNSGGQWCRRDRIDKD